MKINKTVSLCLCVVMLVGLLAACGNNSESVRDDVKAVDIAASIESAIGDADSFVEPPESYIRGSMKMDVSDYSEYSVQINSQGINIDEYGIFKGSDAEQTAKIEQAVNDYLKLRVDIWMPEYMPEEFPKLENADVKTIGNYVMYAILSDEDKAAAFDAFEKALKA